MRHEECSSILFSADASELPDDRVGYYQFEVILGNEIEQYNNFTLGLHVLPRPAEVTDAIPQGLPVDPSVVDIPIIFESPDLTRYELGQTGRLTLYFDEGKRIEEASGRRLQEAIGVRPDAPEPITTQEAPDPADYSGMLLDFYLDPPDLNADEPINMQYRVLSVSKDTIDIALDFGCPECVSNVSICLLNLFM
jgi:hypothetical protein